MADPTPTAPKKTTPESTRRFRLTLAALKAVEEAADHEVQTAIGEFDTFRELYIAAKLREVDARNPPVAVSQYTYMKDAPVDIGNVKIGATLGGFVPTETTKSST